MNPFFAGPNPNPFFANPSGSNPIISLFNTSTIVKEIINDLK